MHSEMIAAQALSGANAPILTPALVALRNGFNIAFPKRDKASDGWIGDAEHQGRTSGHNPDDTPGSRPESEDADTIAEVRAIDVDADLRTVGWTMQHAINAILDTPKDLRRLRYIIYAETVWSASDGWLPRHYSGTDPHTTHAHFSGDPLRDADASPWSVQSLGDNVYSEAQMKAFPWQYGGGGIDAASTLVALNEIWRETRHLMATLDEINKKLDQVLAQPSSVVGQHVHETGPAVPTDVLST